MPKKESKITDIPLEQGIRDLHAALDEVLEEAGISTSSKRDEKMKKKLANSMDRCCILWRCSDGASDGYSRHVESDDSSSDKPSPDKSENADTSAPEASKYQFKTEPAKSSGQPAASATTDPKPSTSKSDKNGLKSPTIYPHAKDQLAALGRYLDEVPPDGNCAFESIARQMQPPSPQSAALLRAYATALAREYPERFEGFLATSTREQFLAEIWHLKQDGVWDRAIGDLAITMTQAVINKKIVVIRTGAKPQIFPDDDQPIDDNSIVIVQDHSQSHYDATKLLYWDDGQRAYGLAAQQISFYGREIDPVYPDGNNMFEAIARQYDGGRYSHQQMRNLVSRHAIANAHRYHHLFELAGNSKESFIRMMEAAQTPGYWRRPLAYIVAEVASEQLNTRIIVVREGAPLVYFTDDNQQMNEDDIVIVKDHNSASHFDATKKRVETTGLVGYGSSAQQIAEVNRVVAIHDDNQDSLFHSISSQVPELNMGGGRFKRHVRETMLARFEDFLTFASKRRNEEELKIDYEFFTAGEWRKELRDPILRAIHFHLRRKIVVIHNHSKPQHIPNDDTPVDENTIVIVEAYSDYYETRFHGTAVKATSAMFMAAFEEMEQAKTCCDTPFVQLARRVIKPLDKLILKYGKKKHFRRAREKATEIEQGKIQAEVERDRKLAEIHDVLNTGVEDPDVEHTLDQPLMPQPSTSRRRPIEDPSRPASTGAAQHPPTPSFPESYRKSRIADTRVKYADEDSDY